MHIALKINVQVKDGTLVLTDSEGKTVTFSKDQTVQKKVSMITLGELCDLPKQQVATGFGFKTRKSYYDIRPAVLQGPPAALLPKRTGPHKPSKRTREVEVLILRMRFETELNMYEIADAVTQRGFPVSARLVGQVLTDYGLSQKNGCPPHPSQPASSPKRRAKSSTAPASRARASSPGTTSSMTSRPCSNGG